MVSTPLLLAPRSHPAAISLPHAASYIKLGQILSIRPDVLPPDVMVELARLQDKIKPFSTEEARAMIEADLGAPVDEIFSEFTVEPIAAASLAQVGMGKGVLDGVAKGRDRRPDTFSPGPLSPSSSLCSSIQSGLPGPRSGDGPGGGGQGAAASGAVNDQQGDLRSAVGMWREETARG